MKQSKNSARGGLDFVRKAALLASVVMSLLWPSVVRSQESGTPKRILVLYWYDKAYPASVRFDQSFQSVLQSAPPGTIEYYPEYLESNRFPGENQSRLLHDYLRQKYAGRTIDVVVASTDPPLDFLLNNRNDLFPNVPIVFSAVKRPTTKELTAGPGMTGILHATTHRRTIDLALRLHPGVERVFVISGTIQRDKKYEALAREQLQGYQGRAQITYLTDLAPDELIAKTKSLPERSIILYSWQQSVKEQGKLLESPDTLALVAQSARVPIYGLAGANIGHGIIGGYVSTTEANATKVAEIALQVANGARVQDIPVENAPIFTMFDWHQLRRWGISEDKLPPGSIIHFKELTFWQHYKWRIAGVLGLCALQALLISILLIERAQRRRAKTALDERLRFETLLSELSADFTSLQAPKVDLGIDMGLKRLAGFLGVNAGAFLEISESDLNQRNTAVLGEPPLAGLPDEQRRWCMDQLHRGVTVNLRRVAEGPAEEERPGGNGSGSTGVKSFLAIPIAANGSACALTFATRESYRDWPEDLVQRLRLAGEIFAGAVVRKKHEEALRESEERYRAFFELTAVGAGQASPDDGHFLRVNEAHSRITGYTREELLALRFSDITHPEDRDKDLEKFRRLIRGEVTEYSSEKRYLHKRGNPVWVQVDVSLVRDAQGRPLHTVAIVQDINARKRAQEALAQSEAFNRRIIESSSDCMTILDLEGRVLYLNPRGQQLLEIDDLASYRYTSWLDVWQGADKAAATLALQQAKDGGPGGFQGFCPTRGGRPKWWDVALAPMRDAKGTVERLLVVSRDITERKRGEALRAGQTQILEMIATNAALEAILGTLASFIESQSDGMLCSILLLDEDGVHIRHGAAPSLPESYTKLIDGLSIGPQVGSCGTAMHRGQPVIVTDILEDPLWNDYRDLAAAHGLRACWSTPIFSSQGKVLGSFVMYYREPRSPNPSEGALIDLAIHTAGIAIERKRAESALRESEARNRAMLAALPDMMFLLSREGVYLDCHVRNPDELYTRPEQFLGKNLREILPAEIAEGFARKFEQAASSSDVVTLEYSLPVSDGVRFYEARIVSSSNDKFLAIVRDITARKHVEETLRQSQERYKLATSAGRVGVWDWNLQTGATYVDPFLKDLVGYGEEILNHYDSDSWQFIHPDDTALVRERVYDHIEGRLPHFEVEHRALHKDGSVRWLQVRGLSIRNEEGTAVRMIGTTVDVTWRKVAEEALRFSEQRFRQLAENIRSVFFVTEVGNGTVPGQILYVSPAYETIWGRSCESLYRDTRSWLEAVHPDDRKRLEPELPNLTKGEFDEEFRIVRTGGKVRWVHSRVFPILDEHGRVYRVAGIVDDITGRKQAEEALRDREERLRLTCEAGRMGVWDWDIPANKVVWSKDIFSILGLEPFSIEPSYGNWTERIHSDDLSRVEEALNAAIRRHETYQAEYRIIRPDGTIRWTEGRGRPTYNEAGDCISMQGLVIDITERKQAEEALRESEERYRNVVETQTELICRNLPDTTLTFVNDAYCRYFNRTREELIGTKFLEFIPEAVHPAVLRHVEALMESRSPDTSEHEHEVIRPDGSVGWQQWVNRKIFNAKGQVVEIQGIGRDITERKRAENALRQSEERYRNVVETQTELICRYECDTTLTFVNDAYCRYFGKTREQLIGTKFLELIPEEARPAASAHVESLLDNPRIETDEHQVIREDGTIGWQQWVDYAIRDADGTIMEMQAIGRDITERKRLEENLQGREREFSTLVENSPDIISRLDRDLRYLYISPLVERVLGVPPHHFIGKTTREIGAPPHDWDAFESSCRQAFQTGEIVDREFSYGGRHYHSRLIPEFGSGSSVDSVMCISEDITERRRAERELVQMSVRLLGLQEEERRRISRELHDVTAQNLFATTINLARLQPPAVSSEVKDVLAECQSLCEQALQEIRTLSYLLHPPILDEAGLVSALTWYIDGFSKRCGIDVGLFVTPEFDRLPREVEADLFRIVQESLANVHRHSGSITANVRLERQNTQVVLQIRDQGHGMRTEATTPRDDAATLGVGIPGMRHRLRQLGGYLTIESSSQGTTVTAAVPLRAERRLRSRASHGSG